MTILALPFTAGLMAGTRVCLQVVGTPGLWVGEAKDHTSGRLGLLLGDEPGAGDIPRGAAVRLARPVAAGVLRADGTVRGTNGALVVVEGLESVDRRIDRDFTRVPVDRARLRCRSDGARKGHEVELLDLSEGGARITAPPGARVGEVVVITDPEADGRPSELTGVVMGLSKEGRSTVAHVAFRATSDRRALVALAGRLAV